MFCLDCGNCRQGFSMYYCTGRNDFIVEETSVVRERGGERWRKGDQQYEDHRRQSRKEKVSQHT